MARSAIGGRISSLLRFRGWAAHSGCLARRKSRSAGLVSRSSPGLRFLRLIMTLWRLMKRWPRRVWDLPQNRVSGNRSRREGFWRRVASIGARRRSEEGRMRVLVPPDVSDSGLRGACTARQTLMRCAPAWRRARHLMGAVVVDRAAPNDSICGSRTIRYVEAERFDMRNRRQGRRRWKCRDELHSGVRRRSFVRRPSQPRWRLTFDERRRGCGRKAFAANEAARSASKTEAGECF